LVGFTLDLFFLSDFAVAAVVLDSKARFCGISFILLISLARASTDNITGALGGLILFFSFLSHIPCHQSRYL